MSLLQYLMITNYHLDLLKGASYTNTNINYNGIMEARKWNMTKAECTQHLMQMN